MLWINGGSNLDDNGKKGINNVLTSLLSRGCEGFDNIQFSDYLDSHGADLNIEIFEDGILVSLKSLNEHFRKLFPLIDLILEKPTLSEKQFINVRKSILNSIRKEKENPFNIVFEKWRKIVYSNHSYAFNCNGYEDDILNIKHKDLISEYENFRSRDKYLITNNSELNYKVFDNKNNYLNDKELNNIYSKNRTSIRFIKTIQETNQVILMIGNQTCSHLSKDYLSLKLLESYLSFGMSSVLFKLFREKNGLTYDVGVYNPLRKQNSPFLIYLSVSNKNALLAFEILSELWQKLLTFLITEKDLYFAKIKFKSLFLISNQTLDEILQRKIKLIGFDLDPDFDYLAKIEDVNSEEILKVTKKYLSKPFISVYGDEKICNEINKLWIKNF